jgi:NADH:ubiquinone oxidoreductase subunit 6 (subunit J)
MGYLLLITGSIFCAALAIRARRLLTAALWLAGVSVFTALILYFIGAREVAVIELSVGAGLVTVLFVFAISIAGEDALRSPPLIPKPAAWTLITLAVLLLGFLILPRGESQNMASGQSFVAIFWQDRALDLLAQVALIFAGVLGVLGLLSEPKSYPPPQSTTEVQEAEAILCEPELHNVLEAQPEEELV